MKLPPIYTINLDRDAERWQRMEQIARTAGIPNMQRFSAINGKNMVDSQFRASTTWLGRQLQPVGVLGCALSHIALWKKIIEDDIPSAIILEDDVELVPNFRDKLEFNLQQLSRTFPALQLLRASTDTPPPSTHTATPTTTPISARDTGAVDVILLGGMGRVHPQGQDSLVSRLFSWYMGGRQTLFHHSATVYRPVRPAGTHAYLVTQQGARKLLQACPKARFHIDIDAWGQASVDVLMFNPMLAYQSFASSTLVDHSNRGTHRNSLLGQLLHAEVGALLPPTVADPFTRQPWRHALAEPLLQLPAASAMTPWRRSGGGEGRVLRTDQCLAMCCAGGLLAMTCHFLRFHWLTTMLLRGTVGFAVLIRVLIGLLLHST